MVDWRSHQGCSQFDCSQMSTGPNLAHQGPKELLPATEFSARATARPNGLSARLGCISCGSERTREFMVASDRFFARSNMYRLLQCESCSLVWLADPPEASEMDRHYGPIYDQFIRRATDKESEKHWGRAVATVQRYSQGGRLLDLGCGSGSFLHC